MSGLQGAYAAALSLLTAGRLTSSRQDPEAVAKIKSVTGDSLTMAVDW